jgi:transcriptional regulator with XRE-family HTH domain
MSLFFSVNLKFLRKRKKYSQEEVAMAVKLKRHDIDNYERGKTPTPDRMVAITDFFKINLDAMLRIDLSKLSEFNLSEIESGHEAYIKGAKIRVHATTVDSRNRENVELVSQKAKAGYTAGYNDPEFISGLPTFQLPFLSRDRKYRMFQIDGNSMLPIPDKAYIVGEYVVNWNDVKDGGAYVFLTRNEGIVFKVAYNEIRKRKHVLLKSLNKEYHPYEIPVTEILEIWKFVNYISSEIPQSNISDNSIIQKVDELRELIIKQ